MEEGVRQPPRLPPFFSLFNLHQERGYQWWHIHSCIQRGVTSAIKWNRTIPFILFHDLSITLINKHLHMPPLAISISPKQFRCYLKQFLQNNSGAVQIILRISLSSQTRHHTLSVSSQRFVNNVDMIETPLRSIVSSGIWKSVMTPTHSTMN